jgi:hypothetical protein
MRKLNAELRPTKTLQVFLSDFDLPDVPPHEGVTCFGFLVVASTGDLPVGALIIGTEVEGQVAPFLGSFEERFPNGEEAVALLQSCAVWYITQHEVDQEIHLLPL